MAFLVVEKDVRLEYGQGAVFFHAAQKTNQVGVAVSGQFDWQALNGLKATGMRLGLRVNFDRYSKATVERILL